MFVKENIFRRDVSYYFSAEGKSISSRVRDEFSNEATEIAEAVIKRFVVVEPFVSKCVGFSMCVEDECVITLTSDTFIEFIPIKRKNSESTTTVYVTDCVDIAIIHAVVNGQMSGDYANNAVGALTYKHCRDWYKKFIPEYEKTWTEA